MKIHGFRRSLLIPITLCLAGAIALPQTSHAQQQADDTGYRTSESGAADTPQPGGYAVSETPADKAADKGDLKAEGPVRMARFAFISGNVTWRAEGAGDWSQATVNMPLRQGAEILVLKGGRADIQFDDGSSLRLGNGALISLKTLFSDDKGEFTQITLKDGLATLHSRHTDAVYQVDTPIISVKSVGPSQIRFGVDGGSEVSVQEGSAKLDGPQGKSTLKAGSYIYLETVNSEMVERSAPGPDSWDRWNTDRNRLIAGTTETYKHVPSNIGLVAEDMDGYGVWHEDPKYGWVWAPNAQNSDWRPYEYGNWTWADPYGWTWVSSEPWGWAPYHYGTWCNLSWGWSWCPGPRSQYWSPGVVSFCSFGGRIGWAPLCPWEVVYPTFCSVGCWGTGWGLDFSIGWCGCYYPGGRNFCEGRRFDNRFVNSFRDHDGRFGADRRFGNSLEAHGSNHGFVPFNARGAAGATSATTAAFGGRGGYQPMTKAEGSQFSNGHAVTAGTRGAPVSGPANIQPSAISKTSSRGFVSSSPSREAASRSTFSGSAATERSAVGSGTSTGGFLRNGTSSSAAEAARQARASLGNYNGSGSSSRTTGSYGSSSGRSFGGASESTRSFSSNSSGSTNARSYGGGFSRSGGGQSYRVGPSYHGSGYSGSSGGSRSSGSSGSSGGGGRSAPSSGGRH